MKKLLAHTLLVVLLMPQAAQAGAYLVADESNPDIRLHERNFAGFGGDLEPIRVCMDVQANEPMAIQAEPALLKAIATVNRFRSLGQHTLAFGAATDLPSGQFDFESVLLHELMHNHGLAHPNHADESGLPSPLDNGTKSANGPDNVFNQGAGADGLHGSADDVRGDDLNLHWYQKGVNNPGLLASVIDDSTMARTLNFLAGGQLFAANADRQVLAALGLVNAEAVAQQGASANEVQRHLQHDDIATIQLARSGLNGIQGDSDDYRTQMVYRGRALDPQGEACQIAVRFDTSTAFATSSIGSFRLSAARPNNWALFHTRMRFNPTVNWYFSPGPNTVTTIVSDLPDASTLLAPITVRVQVVKAVGNPIAGDPQGLVEVRDGPRHEASTAFCSITLLGTPGEIGECVLTPLRTGSKTLVADYLGHGGFDGGSDSEAHVSSGVLEFSAISDSPDPAAVGAATLFQWTLAPPVGAPAALETGSVTVKDAPDCASAALDPAHQCTVNLPANSCPITFNSVGSKTMQLCYSGSAAYPPASASTAHEVTAGRVTTTSITSNLPNPTQPLSPVTVQITVRETPDLGGLPSGIVQVLDGPANDPLTARCTINLTGTTAEVGSCTLHPLRAGTRTLNASFAAQGIWASSVGTAAQGVGSFAIVRNQPSPSRPRQGVHITVNLDVAAFLGSPAPTGTITVRDGVDQCQIVLPASECLWFGTTPGARSLVASWPGDLNYPPRTSLAVAQTVTPDTVLKLVSSPINGYPDSNGASTAASQGLSADGRFVVFSSLASQLVDGDSNGVSDIFIRDQRSGLVRRVSTSASDGQGNGPSREAAISANGRFVAFTSTASNLVSGDTNNVVDVFVKDLSNGSIVRATLKSDGSEDTTLNNFFTDLAPSLSADGRYVAFQTGGQLSPLDTSVHNDVYVRDLQTGALDIVSSNSQDVIGDFRSFEPAISGDGRYVAFQSQAFNFSANDRNDTVDVWRKDRLTRILAFVSSDAAGMGGIDPTDSSFVPAISSDGRYVAFTSFSNLLIAGDLNNNSDIFLKDVDTGAIERLSASSAGVAGNNGSDSAAISGDGRYVVFRSTSTNLVAGDTNLTGDIFLRDRQSNTTTRVNLNPNSAQVAGGASEFPAISSDGRFISYQSAAATLVPNDGNALIDVFVRDRLAVPSVRASAVNLGARVDGSSNEASISRDGQYLAFTSAASTLVSGDSNGSADIFLRHPASNSTTLVSAGTLTANAASDSPTISGDSLSVVFRSAANNLVVPDSNNASDIFVKQRLNNAVERVSTATGGAQLSSNVLRVGTSISYDGNLVLFHAGDSNLVAGDSNGFDDVLLKDRSSNVTSLISRTATGTLGNGHSSQAQISADGTRVVFVSSASNLLPGDSNNVADVFAKYLGENALLRVSTGLAGAEANGASGNPSISSNGRLVLFTSAASNLVADDSNGAVDVFLRDLQNDSIVRISTDAAGAQGTGGDCSATSISASGRYAGFTCAMNNLVPGDSNGLADAFVKDLVTGAITRMSLSDALVQADAASTISARALSDAGFMAFSSTASNLLPAHNLDGSEDVFLNQFSTTPALGTTTLITSHTPNPSARDGSYLVGVSVTRSSGSANVRGTVRVSEGSASCFANLSGAGPTAVGNCALSAFTVGTKTLNASYGGDQEYAASDAASVSHSVAPIVARAPSIGTARAGNGEVQVYFTAPADNGGAPILGYYASCGGAGAGALGTVSPIVVGGLSNGVAVTCSVYASNSAGNGLLSTASNSVTPNTGQTVVGPFAYVPRNNTGQMALIDLGSNTILSSISGGAGIGIAVAPNGLRAYAIDQGFNAIRVINTQSRSLVTSIAVGAGPWSAVVSPDNSRLYVSIRNTNSVSVIDTSNNTVLSTFGVAAAPTMLAISPNGGTLYVGSANTTNLSVVTLPANTVNQVNVGTTTHGLVISPDGTRLYLVNGQVAGRMLAFNTTNNTVAGSVNVGGVPLGVSVSSDGSRVYVSNNGGNGNVNGNTVSQINASTLAVIATGATGPRPNGIDVHPDGSRVYVGNNNGTMSVLETATMGLVATIDMGSADAISAVGNFIARASTPTADRKLAVGSITLPATIAGANAATRVFFPQPFAATPVVIVQADDSGGDPRALRLININASSFDVLQVEPTGCPGCNGAGAAMNVHWLAALPGAYRLSNDVPMLNNRAPNVPGPGVLIKVGSVLTMASQRSAMFGGFAGFPTASWQAVSYPVAAGFEFAGPPVVLSSIQSWGVANTAGNLSVPTLPGQVSLTGVSRLWLTPAVRNVSMTGFETALESSSSDDSGSAAPGLKQPESIGYVAIEGGTSTQLVAVGGSLLGLATGVGTANDVCGAGNGVTLSFPAGTATNAANLRGFAGLQSRNEEDGGWLRRCSLSTPLGTVVSLIARVDEDAHLSPDRAHPTTESISTAIFGGDFTTTPVTLAFLRATRVGSQLDVRFGSATEAGHLGYRIWGRVEKTQEWQPLHQDLLVNSSGDSMRAKSYQRTVEALGSTEIRIEDVDVRGISRFHPALSVDSAMGSEAVDAPLDWQAIRTSNAATPIRALRLGGSNQVLAEVRRTGIQRLSFADLSAAGFSEISSASVLAVLEEGRPLPRFVSCPSASFGPGCYVEWLGRTRQSLYGKSRIYLIKADAASAVPVTSGALASTGASPRVVSAELLQAPDRVYSFSAPGNDPWFDQRLVATTAPVELTRTFTLSERTAGAVNLSVMLWGGLDFPGAAPDHSVDLLLNGQVIASRRFDGLTAETLSLPLTESQLQPSNTLTLRLPANTGYSADVVLLDGFKISYSRTSTLSAGELQFGTFSPASTGSELFASGFEDRAGFTLVGVAGPTAVWTQIGSALRRDQLSSAVALDTRINALFAADEAHIQKPVVRAAVNPQQDFSPVDYLIVTHPLFEAELAALVTLQQSRGYSVKVVRTDAIYAAKSQNQRSPQAIREAITQINPRFVLLVGGDSYDYDDNLGIGSQSYLPTFYRVADPIVRFAASDLGFADADGNGSPERAIGRIPARTVEELRRAISAITERANTPAVRYFATAGVSSASEHFDVHSRTLFSYLRQGQPTEFALVDEIGLSEARSLSSAALAGSADWINYLGHSSPNRWTLQNLLDTSQLSAITRTGLPAIVSQWGCWNNYFVLPNQDTMSHALTLRSNRLAAAVIGSSSLAEDESHLALGTRFFDLVEDGRISDNAGVVINTLGEALLAAKKDLAQGAPEHVGSNYSITLFGDPAMPLR